MNDIDFNFKPFINSNQQSFYISL